MNLFELLAKRYNPNQPRDANGRWGRGGARAADVMEAPQSSQRDARGIPMPPDTSKWGAAADRPKRQMAGLYEAAQRGDIDSIRGTKTTRSNTYARTVDDYRAKLLGHFEEGGQVVQPPPAPERPRRKPKPKEKTLEELDVFASRRTADEKNFNRFAFGDADPELKELVGVTPPVVVRRDGKPGVAWHQAGNTNRHATLEMSRFTPETREGQVVWAHEYGHQIDGASAAMNGPVGGVQQRFASSSRETNRAMSQDKGSLMIGGSTRLSNRGIELSTALVSLTGQERIMANDFFGAMTLNEIGWGHSAQYYKESVNKVDGIGDRRHAEMFGNYIALRAAGGPAYKAIRDFAPESVKHFDSLVTKMVAHNKKRSQDKWRMYKRDTE